MLKLLPAIVVLPAGVVLAWLALSERSQRADFVVASDVLRTIDPDRVSWLDEIQVAGALFEGLTRLDPRTLLPEPGVARSWRLDRDTNTYTFMLRNNARWSNGQPVIAEHFRFAWLRVLDPQVQAQYASLLFVIDGAREYYDSRLDDDPANDVPAAAVGVTALDDQTLCVRLAAPCSYFLDLTSFPTLAPLYPPTIRQWAYREGKVLRETQRLWTRSENIVCNGAFTLERWDFKRRLLLRRNPHYWDASVSDVGSIEIFIAPDAAAALVAYETGRIDLLRRFEPEVAITLRKRALAGLRDDFQVGDRFATYFFRVNCERAPLDNADFRKALALAIDKRALCEDVLGLGETPADTFVPPGAIPLMPRLAPDGSRILYDPPAGLGADLDAAERGRAARAFLKKCGYADASDVRPIELAFAPQPAIQRRIAEAVQSMWRETLGLRVELRMVERKVLSTRIRALDYDIARSDWYGDYMDPATFLDMFVSGSGQNRTGWENAEYDRLITAAAVEPDNARRFAVFRDAERILCEEQLPIIPLYFKRGSILLNPRFTGIGDNVRDILPIHRVRLAER